MTAAIPMNVIVEPENVMIYGASMTNFSNSVTTAVSASGYEIKLYSFQTKLDLCRTP
jgi:hypothetical protein